MGRSEVTMSDLKLLREAFEFAGIQTGSPGGGQQTTTTTSHVSAGSPRSRGNAPTDAELLASFGVQMSPRSSTYHTSVTSTSPRHSASHSSVTSQSHQQDGYTADVTYTVESHNESHIAHHQTHVDTAALSPRSTPQAGQTGHTRLGPGHEVAGRRSDAVILQSHHGSLTSHVDSTTISSDVIQTISHSHQFNDQEDCVSPRSRPKRQEDLAQERVRCQPKAIIEMDEQAILSPRSSMGRAWQESRPQGQVGVREGYYKTTHTMEIEKSDGVQKVLPTIERGSETEEHVYRKQTFSEQMLPERIVVTSEQIDEEQATVIPDVREVVQVVEEIITIPRVRRETREVIKEIPVERVVQRIVEVPRTERRVRQKPVFKEVEEIVELPKIRYIEEIVEVEVPFHKIEEVPEVIERLVPTFVTKHVNKPCEQFRDVIKVVERKQERIVEVPKYTYERKTIEVPVETIEEVPKYVEVPQVVERVHIRKVQTIQEEVVRRPVVKQVTREVIREIPKSRKVLREVAVDQMVEVPKIIEIPREILIEDEQIIEIPRYIENIKHVYHHASHETQYKQKELQHHKKRIVQSVFEQKQVTIKPKVVHVPKFIEVDVIEWVDVVTEKPVEVVREEVVEVPKVTYEDIEEEVASIRTKKRYVDVERVERIVKYVEVPKQEIVRVPKVMYLDNTQVIKNIVEYVEVPVIKKVEKIIEVPKIEYVETIVEVPEIKTVTTFVDDVTVEEVINYVDIHVDVVEEEVVQIPNIRTVERPEIVYVDTTMTVPKIKKVGKIVEIEREIHHDVFEETTSEINLGSEVKEDVIHDRIHVRAGETEPEIGECLHVWDRSKIPPEYQNYELPEMSFDGVRIEHDSSFIQTVSHHSSYSEQTEFRGHHEHNIHHELEEKAHRW